MSRPVFTILAGSNGGGKSSLTTLSKTNFQRYPVLDPDAISSTLQKEVGSEHSDIEAGKQVLRHADDLASVSTSSASSLCARA